ncbi:hypothetical protein [Frateuria terrea]|uniref:hypothetical protein n=1 Tax=Frateuria terrea TaxID=529704 RepID=UPI001114688E|nr:hypothetical protein [Frateuria terrea]
MDTTVLVEIADLQAGSSARSFISANQPAEVPYYALRELLAGLLRTLCDAHNKLVAAENPAEAFLVLTALHSVAGRKKDSAIRALAVELSEAFKANPDGPRSDLKREMLQAFSLKIASLWKQARRPSQCAAVQSLACFNAGDLARGEAGELRGPNDSFNCLGGERCAAAMYLSQNQTLLTKLIDALHPDNLGDEAASKRENQQRRKALKAIKVDGPLRFNKSLCRAVGDAYFAAMCPPGMDVITTNITDHGFLCEAVGKKATRLP